MPRTFLTFLLLLPFLGGLCLAAGPAFAECEPCKDPARSEPRYGFAVSKAGREMLVAAARATNMVFTFATVRACNWDSTAMPPGYRCVTTSADTLALWRTALEHLAATGGASGDSAGAVGIALLASIDRAQAHPERMQTAAMGRLVREKGRVWLRACGAPLEVRGPGGDSLASKDGAQVWMQGTCRDSGGIDWVGGHALGRRRMDLFVMGRCPFARRLEAHLVTDLAELPPVETPEIAVHYLLFWDPEKPAQTRVASLHGDEERTEDGVQILLRDTQPQVFWRYVALRATSDEPWEMLAQKAGMGWQAIDALRRKLARDLDAMLIAEHLHVTRDFAHVDGSPTVYWQGAEVRSLGQVPGFTAVPRASGEKCQN